MVGERGTRRGEGYREVGRGRRVREEAERRRDREGRGKGRGSRVEKGREGKSRKE
jgi:hypothetical protein